MITADVILHDLEVFIYKEICATHGEKMALSSAKALFECLWLNFRKGLMYVPTSKNEDLNERYESIWNDFKGSNHHELAIKYRLSLPQIYTITNKMRNSFMRKNQTDIFPLPEEKNSKPITLFVIEEYLPTELIKCGLSEPEATSLAQKVSSYLCEKFPGVSVCISDALRKKRADKGQSDLF